jgi:hypothetical protein
VPIGEQEVRSVIREHWQDRRESTLSTLALAALLAGALLRTLDSTADTSVSFVSTLWAMTRPAAQTVLMPGSALKLVRPDQGVAHED